MRNCPAARIGDSWDEIDTPALVVELDALEANIRSIAEFGRRTGVRLRPHAKTHKCSAIARLQVAHGAVGICCQKVGEAEAMVDGGIGDVLVTNEVVGRRKLNRLAALATRARIAVCADDPGNVGEIAAAAARFDSRLSVLVEMDVGAGRCGVATPREALGLARRIADAAHLRFGGLQAYHGPAQHVRSHAARRARIEAAAAMVAETLDLFGREGLPAETVGGAGTGTFELEATSGLWNELQVGSYVFMDADYARNLDETGAPVSEFRHSLTIKTGVISAPAPGRIVTDAGLKAYSTDRGLPQLMGGPRAEVLSASDEHTTIRVHDPAERPELGAALRLVPGHCDPTVNLHDWIVGVRGDRVECLWPVDARGALL